MTPHDPTPHLTEEQIAHLAQASEPDPVVLEHLRGCEQCLADYLYLVRESGIQHAVGLPAVADELVRLGVRTTRPASRATPPLLRALATAFAAVVLIAAIILWRLGGEAPGLDPTITRPIQQAVVNVSNRALFVIPGSEALLIGDPPVYRSGFVTGDDAVTNSLRTLVDRSKQDGASTDVARWMIAGFLATGQLEIAGDLAEDAVRDFPDDSTIGTLAGLVAYCAGDDAKAERRLRAVIEAHPNDGTALVDLALVLARLQRSDEARQLLARVDSKDLEKRAAAILEKL